MTAIDVTCNEHCDDVLERISWHTDHTDEVDNGRSGALDEDPCSEDKVATEQFADVLQAVLRKFGITFDDHRGFDRT